MKPYHLLFLVGCLKSTSLQAQQLRGAYYRIAKERGFSSELFQFTGNRFRFVEAGCLGSTEGQGTFVLRNDSLLLYCQKIAADTAVTAVQLVDTAAVPTFCFRVLDKATGNTLPGVSITSRAQRAGVATDTSGQARLTCLLPTGDELRLKYVGYNDVIIPLHTTASQLFTVRMGSPYCFTAGDTLVYQLKDVRATSFAYRPLLDMQEVEDDERPYSHCEKISALKARQLFRRK